MTRSYAIPPTQNGVPLAGETDSRPSNQPHGQTWFNETTGQLEVRNDLASANRTVSTFPVSQAIVDLAGAGAPSNGTTGKDVSGPGSLYRDISAGVLYINTGTAASPTWAKVGTQT